MAPGRAWRISNFGNRSLSFLLGVAVGTGLRELYMDLVQSKRNEPVHSEAQKSEIINTGSRIASPSLAHFDRVYGLPRPLTRELTYSNHALSYDNCKRVPVWVVESINSEQLKKTEADRQNSQFRIDSNIPEKFRSVNEDYLGSGYSRGHMVPAGSCKYNQQAMDETFFLSNIVPQDQENNAGFWYRMELYCRHLAKKYDSVFVVSGPLFLPVLDKETERKFVKYEVIGKNNVAVPTHLFKVIVAERSSTPRCLGAFIVPNRPIAEHQSLRDYQVPLEELEKVAGLELLPKLNGTSVADLCLTDGCRLIALEKLAFINTSRMLRSAKSMDDLNGMWTYVNEKKVSVDAAFMKEYEEKKRKFLGNAAA